MGSTIKKTKIKINKKNKAVNSGERECNAIEVHKNFVSKEKLKYCF